MKHYRKIYDIVGTKSTIEAEIIISENKSTLFDSDEMLTDWWKSRKPTYCRSRKKIQVAFDVVDESDYDWPSNEELKFISRHLTQDSMRKICKKLKINYTSGDASDEEKRYESLREWRKKMIYKSLEERHKQLLSALESDKLRGLQLPPVKGRFIYKAELVDMAFDLLMQDLLPVVEALGINDTKLVSYRPAFKQSHLQTGTIDLLSKLLEHVESNSPYDIEILEQKEKRPFLLRRIGKLHYRKVEICGMFVYDMSYGELCSISEAMMQNTGKQNVDQVIPTSKSGGASPCDAELAKSKLNVGEKGSSLCAPSIGLAEDEREEDTDTENAERGQLLEPKDQIPEIEPSKEPGKLHHVLQLTDQDLPDMPDSLESSDSTKAFALFKIWKEKPRSSVFNYRAALSDGLRKIQMTDLADKVIAGNYISEHTSLNFIQNMVQGLIQDQLRNLGKLLNLSGKNEHWHTNTPLDAISQQICDWVGKWTKEMKIRPNLKTFTKVKDDIAEMTSVKTTAEKHRDLNDKLVEHGFLDLAREIMIIEQQLAYA